ncbi:hypothetical protein SPRG_16911 [Saprolegnia parasitica CBS 223.65]|uniref:Uncharacterized protein n=1 Tax=Saprolegnia parasitica (strain CBS 223.65) TaxID=695850 RepID=A0A067BHS0_SAPPC|nr:hypothetical protein SPRG_16911 [Saprolegnia parasitica CBS 223.65]KDO17673.1 hypothetical protein SPRG_16911 [Saprolegnia parasitica CBS 223.65]|eukprot:XP_012211617.1 hypothetical protein SPRG_16911 [Saprolegnia parasitica CBS 223.65]
MPRTSERQAILYELPLADCMWRITENMRLAQSTLEAQPGPLDDDDDEDAAEQRRNEADENFIIGLVTAMAVSTAMASTYVDVALNRPCFARSEEISPAIPSLFLPSFFLLPRFHRV